MNKDIQIAVYYSAMYNFLQTTQDLDWQAKDTARRSTRQYADQHQTTLAEAAHHLLSDMIDNNPEWKAS